MRLEIDAGNTFIKWRVCSTNGEVQQRGSMLTQQLQISDFADIAALPVDRVLIGSVAGQEINRQLEAVVQRLWCCQPLFAQTAACQAGVINSYLDVSKMGVDRWLASVAAYHLAGRQAVMVIDSGSAITLEYISGAGEHEGGYILPGLRLMRESLLRGTAQVRYQPQFIQMPEKARDTAAAVENGVVYLFDALAQRVAADAQKGYELFITGGDGALFHSLIGVGRHVPDLVLDGLQWCIDA